jgi:magnesium transporter
MAANIIFNLLAVTIIAGFENTLAQVVMLAAFLPMITDMGGNIGIQAIGVAIRGLALGKVSFHNLWQVLRKEVVVGLVNGLLLGLQIGVIAYFWKGNIYLGMVITAAMWINVLLAGVVGTTIPFIFRRLGKDPAMMSGAFLTTITDATGLFIFLGLATLVMHRLI